MKNYLLLLLLLLVLYPSYSQKKNAAYKIRISKANSEIKVDGIMDEAAWDEAVVATNFYMILPMDTSYSNLRTEVKMTYDDKNIYLVAVCYNAAPGAYVVESLRRDFNFLRNDNFVVIFDTFDDQINGFSFGVNAAGAQRDGLMFNGTSTDVSWDNKWVSVVKNYDDKWIFEAAIPFKTLRYKKGISEWGINFTRLDIKTNEKGSWAPVPRQFPSSTLAFNGVLQWDEPPPSTGTNISLIPYVMAAGNRNFNSGEGSKNLLDVGGDAKIGLTSSLNLDLTVNPDFSQVDVDRQVTNLERFELFFPERRQFFLENADLFADFGYGTLRPFFSRRIGLGVPINYGARLSGKVNKDWRVGAMNVQTGKVEDLDLPAQNFSVMSVQKRVFSRSNIGAIFINKASFNEGLPNHEVSPHSKYNRNIGLEYNLLSSNNQWTGKAMFLKSFSPDKSGRDFVHAGNLRYNIRQWNLNWRHEYVGENYNAEVGFVPRRGYIRFNPEASHLFFPKGSKILTHGPVVGSSIYLNEALEKTDNESFLAYRVTFRNQSTVMAWGAYDYIKLLRPFDPTNFNGNKLEAGTEHSWNSFGTEFASTPQNLLTYSISSRYGGFYANGRRLNMSGEMGYRFQPFVSLVMNATVNQLELPEPWGGTTFWLIGPRLDVTMTNKLFFTAFAQYNEQMNNMNLNTRLQWRYQPASDLFIVYTDNYLPSPFSVKNRALVFKFTYWWNV
jgi:hypothetical protein